MGTKAQWACWDHTSRKTLLKRSEGPKLYLFNMRSRVTSYNVYVLTCLENISSAASWHQYQDSFAWTSQASVPRQPLTSVRGAWRCTSKGRATRSTRRTKPMICRRLLAPHRIQPREGGNKLCSVGDQRLQRLTL